MVKTEREKKEKIVEKFRKNRKKEEKLQKNKGKNWQK